MLKIDKKDYIDEKIPHGGFHHYDLLFSLAANAAGLKLGTYPIWAVHDSPGLEGQTAEFLQSQEYFLKAANQYI